MQVYPTRPAVHLALAGAAVVLVGVVTRQVALVAWGGGIVFAMALARASALASVQRIRSAGFEMLWSASHRVVSVARGAQIEIEAEVRNRDTRAARYVHLRPVHSSHLAVRVEPVTGEVPAGGRLRVSVWVRAPRVGRHAVHGLALEVQGSPGLFEVPLTFANPFGVEVLPRPFGTMLLTARGGRSRMGTDEGRPGPMAGDGMELRELREHQPGDPFKRIAWRATAKRGRLLVRDFDRDERDIVWIVVDASVELWAGPPGYAPLDLGIDEVSSVAKRHLARGDRVGLAILGGRLRGLLEPDRGAKHARDIALALALVTGCHDADRSELEERDVALRVLEHLRPLDGRMASADRFDIDRLAFRAEAAMQRAPFKGMAPDAPTPRERVLRRYLASFGIESPPRSDPERQRTEEAMVRFLERLARRKPRPSIVHIWSPAPDRPRAELLRAIADLRRASARVHWIAARVDQAVQLGNGTVASIVSDAVILRSRAARERGERALASMGVRVERIRRWGAHPPGHVMAALSTTDTGALSQRISTPPPPKPSHG